MFAGGSFFKKGVFAHGQDGGVNFAVFLEGHGGEFDAGGLPHAHIAYILGLDFHVHFQRTVEGHQGNQGFGFVGHGAHIAFGHFQHHGVHRRTDINQFVHFLSFIELFAGLVQVAAHGDQFLGRAAAPAGKVGGFVRLHAGGLVAQFLNAAFQAQHVAFHGKAVFFHFQKARAGFNALFVELAAHFLKFTINFEAFLAALEVVNGGGDFRGQAFFLLLIRPDAGRKLGVAIIVNIGLHTLFALLRGAGGRRVGNRRFWGRCFWGRCFRGRRGVRNFVHFALQARSVGGKTDDALLQLGKIGLGKGGVQHYQQVAFVHTLPHDHADILDKRDAVGLEHHGRGHGDDFALGGNDFVDFAHNGPEDEHTEHARQGKEGPAGPQRGSGALQKDAVGLKAQDVAGHLARLRGLLLLSFLLRFLLFLLFRRLLRLNCAFGDRQGQGRRRRGTETGGHKGDGALAQLRKKGEKPHSAPCWTAFWRSQSER